MGAIISKHMFWNRHMHPAHAKDLVSNAWNRSLPYTSVFKVQVPVRQRRKVKASC